jgi:hypothetical protein
VKSPDDILLLAKEEAVLQGFIVRLIEIGKPCRMDINVERTKLMITSNQPSPIHIMIDQR